MSAVRCPVVIEKLPHFPLRTVRKHFLLCLSDNLPTAQNQKIIFTLNNTHMKKTITNFRKTIFSCKNKCYGIAILSFFNSGCHRMFPAFSAGGTAVRNGGLITGGHNV